jgi:hypothetical protein
MSNMTFLPGMAAGADPDTTVPVPPDVDDADGAGEDRRRLLMIAGGAAVLLLAGGYYFLHHGSSDSSMTPVTPVHHGVTATGSQGTKSTTPAAGTSLPKATKHTAVRNPFKALVTAPVSSGSDVGGTQDVTGSTTGGTVTGSTTPSGSSPVAVSPLVPTSPSTGGAVTQGTTGKPQWLQLIGTDGDSTATFKVGYAHHRFRTFKVAAPSSSSTRGTVFDGEFALIGIQNGDVTIQVGDATPFDLSKGVQRTL